MDKSMRTMLRLFRICSWPHLKRQRLRWLLALASVLLAVVLFVSMRVIEHSVLTSFHESIRILAGNADASITHGLGIEAAALARIEQIEGIHAAPVIQETDR